MADNFLTEGVHLTNISPKPTRLSQENIVRNITDIGAIICYKQLILGHN